MLKVLISLFVLILVSCHKSSKNPVETLSYKTVQLQITAKETQRILFTLAADSMKGRDSKNGGYFKAAAFVTDYLKLNNIKPFYPEFRDSLVTDNLVSYNLVGQLGDYDPQRKTVLIGAHLDHIGIRGKEGDTIYNGANDNASGSTAVLQISKFLAQYQWGQNVLLALFADEEKRLKGAQHLAKRFQDENIDLAYMVNFEMIGKTLTTGANQVYITGYNSSNMAKVMNAITPDFVHFLPQAKEFNLFQRSDNYSFFKQLNIPAQTLSSFDFQNYDYYHKAEDEAAKMDVENMTQIIQTAAFTLAKMLGDKIEMKLISTSCIRQGQVAYPNDAQ